MTFDEVALSFIPLVQTKTPGLWAALVSFFVCGKWRYEASWRHTERKFCQLFKFWSLNNETVV